MKFMLVFLISTTYSEQLTTQVFADYASCMETGKVMEKFVSDNDRRFGSPVHFDCIKVSGV